MGSLGGTGWLIVGILLLNLGSLTTGFGSMGY
jgi:hypothetical protein